MAGKERWTVYRLLKDKGATEEELKKRPGVPRNVFEQIHTGAIGCKVTRKNLRLEASGWFDSDGQQLPDLVFQLECGTHGVSSAEDKELYYG